MSRGESGVMLVVGGGPVDIDDASWYEQAPCGCVCGVHVAHSGDEFITTAEQALSVFYRDSKRLLAKAKEQGFSCFVGLRSDVKEILATDCPHEPTWGIPPRPQREGYVWAAVHAHGSNSPLMHLVPTAAVEDAAARKYGSGGAKPLCNGKAAFWWKTDWYVLDGKVECQRCWKAAS